MWILNSLSHCRMLDQLTDAIRAHFPVVLTRKYACDKAVVSLLYSRTLGNSPTALLNTLQEIHSEEWLHRQVDTWVPVSDVPKAFKL